MRTIEEINCEIDAVKAEQSEISEKQMILQEDMEQLRSKSRTLNSRFSTLVEEMQAALTARP